MIQESVISEIKSRIVIQDVIGEYVKLKKSGADLEGLCPFHNEKTPSFKVEVKKNMFKCFGCGIGGDAVKFLMEHKKISYIDAIKLLAAKYHIDIVEENQQKKVYTKPTIQNLPLTLNQYEWFKTRGISKNTLDALKVTNSQEWMPKAKAVVNAICFNYYRKDEVINVKYRGSNKDFKLSADAELIFYNLNALEGAKSAIIVEGEIDCLSLHEIGLKRVVSVPNGASVGTQRLEYLDNYIDYFKDMPQIVIMTDGDSPGIGLRDELARRLGYERCFKVTYPDGCKDANDVLVKHGAEALRQVVADATEFPIKGVFTAGELYTDVSNYYHNGYPKGIKLGIHGFDDYLSLMAGQLTIITGIPGCFTKNQLVHTSKGTKPISEIKIGEKVLSYNHEKDVNEYREVLNTFEHKTHPDKLLRLKLKDGTTIEVTEKHLFFTGTEYVQIKDLIVSLNNGKLEKNK